MSLSVELDIKHARVQHAANPSTLDTLWSCIKPSNNDPSLRLSSFFQIVMGPRSSFSSSMFLWEARVASEKPMAEFVPRFKHMAELSQDTPYVPQVPWHKLIQIAILVWTHPPHHGNSWRTGHLLFFLAFLDNIITTCTTRCFFCFLLGFIVRSKPTALQTELASKGNVGSRNTPDLWIAFALRSDTPPKKYHI